MKISRLPCLALAALLLSGCGLLKQKAADYYLDRARKAAAASAPAAAK
jgi:uncharacterized lipoprotein YmbA